MTSRIPDLPVPRTTDRWRELLALREPVRMIGQARAIVGQPRGQRQPVMVIPGFGANDASTIPLRAYLGGLGYECRGWGLGMNTGDLLTQLAEAIMRIEAWSKQRSCRVSLVGWSLGGVIARETARSRPEIVECVITFGTPLWGPRHTNTSMARRSPGRDEIERQILERSGDPIRRPVTAIYSRNDGIVHWEACVDPDPKVLNIEVSSSHIGLGIDPDVWRIVATTLARSVASGEASDRKSRT
jgi:pimeloyl-ACP methyl ester carboxylesterase